MEKGICYKTLFLLFFFTLASVAITLCILKTEVQIINDWTLDREYEK